MEHNDIFFYLVLALSVVGSIVKSVRKKEATDAPSAPKMPSTGDILRKLLDEFQEKETTPKKSWPAPEYRPVSRPTNRPAASRPASSRETSMDLDRKARAERPYVVPEAERASNSAKTAAAPVFQATVSEPADPFLSSLDLHDQDELKKAVIYSEIFRPKF